MIKCVYCGGYVPLAEPRGSETRCTDCGKPYVEVASEDVWYAQRWEHYAPVTDDDDSGPVAA